MLLIPKYFCLRDVIASHYRVEHLSAAGSFTVMMAHELENRGREFSSLKTTVHGAQLVSRKTFERHEKIFGGISWVNRMIHFEALEDFIIL